ncbi:hypothetical protein AB0301_16985 [Microbacterium profundi]|uniref:Uncharacterized protein n=1 Tax=Microbacterium profundi TaxID=450380 RepID=A0ABV3LMX2_9MICO|nr:hypothetical protein [Microbacterium profundi]MCE7483769.1 hypothetical protein [Microbacterium profundi]
MNPARRSSLRAYVSTLAIGAAVGVVVSIAWRCFLVSALIASSDRAGNWESLYWVGVIDATRIALIAAACVAVATLPLALSLRKHRVLAVALSFLAPLIGLPLLGVNAFDTTTYVFMFNAPWLSGLLAGGVSLVIAAIAMLLVVPKATAEPVVDRQADKIVDDLFGHQS